MKLLYCYINVPAEGSRIHIDSFVRAWREAGDELCVFGIDDQPYAGGKDSWSAWRRLRVRLGWYLDNLGYLARLLFRVLVYWPDAVLFRFDPLHRFAASVIGVSLIRPVVLEVNAVRSIELSARRPRISDWLDRVSLSRARRVFVVSGRLKDHLKEFCGVPPAKVAIIENGVDERVFSPAVDGSAVRRQLRADGRFLIGFVGSFRPWHGVGLLIDLAERLARDAPDVLFVMVGDGGERAGYQRDVEARGLAEYVHFVGHVAHVEVPQYLAAMDLLIYPLPEASFRQGFYGSALKIFEYMAMGKAVITSPMGQMNELLEDGVSGFLIPAEDLDSVAHRIMLLRTDDPARSRVGERARETVVRKYTWRANALKVRQLCEEAVRG